MKKAAGIIFFTTLLIIMSGRNMHLSAQDPKSIPHRMAAGLAVPGYVILSNGQSLRTSVSLRTFMTEYVNKKPFSGRN